MAATAEPLLHPVAETPAAGRRTLFTAVRNEAPFLLEWIAYHKAIGFERIIVFSNDSDDGTDELLAALAAAGEIEHHPHVVPEGASPQGNAARLANEMRLLGAGDWVLWLDADEFLVVRAGAGRLDDLIVALGDKRGILIPWRIFGDGGNTTFPGRFVSDAFCAAARKGNPENREVKTLFRMEPEVEGFSKMNVNRPKLSAGCRLTSDDFIYASGATLDPEQNGVRKWLTGDEFGAFSHVRRDTHGYKLAQINHYCVRTPEHFALKKLRGRGWAADQAGERNLRHTAGFYQRMNRNDVEDRHILRFEAEVTAGIAALRRHAAVKRADDRARKRVAGQIAALPAEAVAQVGRGAPPGAPATTAFALTLPAEPAALVESHYRRAGCVLEYGSGGSTVLALRSGVERIYSVESDSGWARRLDAAITEDFPGRHCVLHHADIGATGGWGRATDASGHARYHLYATGIWDRPDFTHPDVVLIDGRFRAACLMTVMLRCTGPTLVLFDDYAERSEYHWVEDILRPSGLTGRMAVFDVAPTSLPPEHLTRIVGAFADQR